MTDETLVLIERAQRGDPGARAALYEKYAARVLAAVRVRLGPGLRSRLESCDVAQSVLLASLRDLDTFEYRGEGAFMHWLSRLVENRIRDKHDYFHAQKRDFRREEPLETDEGRESRGQPADTPTPSQQVIMSEQALRLEHAIDSLPKEQRDAILYVRYEGLSYEEAAEVMGRSKDAVRMLLARGMAQLSMMLAEDRHE